MSTQSNHTFRLNAEDNVTPVLRQLERNAQGTAKKVSNAGARIATGSPGPGARGDVFMQGQNILGNRNLAGMARASRAREASGRAPGQADRAIRDFDKMRMYLEKNYRVSVRTFPEMLQVMKKQGLLTQQRESKMERMLQSIERATQQQTRAIQSQRAEAARAVPRGGRQAAQRAGQAATGAAVVAGAGRAAAPQTRQQPARQPQSAPARPQEQPRQPYSRTQAFARSTRDTSLATNEQRAQRAIIERFTQRSHDMRSRFETPEQLHAFAVAEAEKARAEGTRRSRAKNPRDRAATGSRAYQRRFLEVVGDFGFGTSPGAERRSGEVRRRQLPPGQRQPRERGMWSAHQRRINTEGITNAIERTRPDDAFRGGVATGTAPAIGAYSADAGLVEGLWEQRRSGMGLESQDIERSLVARIPEVGFYQSMARMDDAGRLSHLESEGMNYGNVRKESDLALASKRGREHNKKRRAALNRKWALRRQILERRAQGYDVTDLERQLSGQERMIEQHFPRRVAESRYDFEQPGMAMYETGKPSWATHGQKLSEAGVRAETRPDRLRMGLDRLKELEQRGFEGAAPHVESAVRDRIDQLEHVTIPEAELAAPVSLYMGGDERSRPRVIDQPFTPANLRHLSGQKLQEAIAARQNRFSSQVEDELARDRGGAASGAGSFLSQREQMIFATMRRPREIPLGQLVGDESIGADLHTKSPLLMWDKMIDQYMPEGGDWDPDQVQAAIKRRQAEPVQPTVRTPGMSMMEMLMVDAQQRAMAQGQVTGVGGRDVRMGDFDRQYQRPPRPYRYKPSGREGYMPYGVKSTPETRSKYWKGNLFPATMRDVRTPNLVRGMGAILGTGVGIAGAQEPPMGMGDFMSEAGGGFWDYGGDPGELPNIYAGEPGWTTEMGRQAYNWQWFDDLHEEVQRVEELEFDPAEDPYAQPGPRRRRRQRPDRGAWSRFARQSFEHIGTAHRIRQGSGAGVAPQPIMPSPPFQETVRQPTIPLTTYGSAAGRPQLFAESDFFRVKDNWRRSPADVFNAAAQGNPEAQRVAAILQAGGGQPPQAPQGAAGGGRQPPRKPPDTTIPSPSGGGRRGFFGRGGPFDYNVPYQFEGHQVEPGGAAIPFFGRIGEYFSGQEAKDRLRQRRSEAAYTFARQRQEIGTRLQDVAFQAGQEVIPSTFDQITRLEQIQQPTEAQVQQLDLLRKTGQEFPTLVDNVTELAQKGQLSVNTLQSIATSASDMGDRFKNAGISDFGREVEQLSGEYANITAEYRKANIEQRYLTDAGYGMERSMIATSSAAQGMILGMAALEGNITNLAFSLVFLRFSALSKLSLGLAAATFGIGTMVEKVNELIQKQKELTQSSTDVGATFFNAEAHAFLQEEAADFRTEIGTTAMDSEWWNKFYEVSPQVAAELLPYVPEDSGIDPLQIAFHHMATMTPDEITPETATEISGAIQEAVIRGYSPGQAISLTTGFDLQRSADEQIQEAIAQAEIAQAETWAGSKSQVPVIGGIFDWLSDAVGAGVDQQIFSREISLASVINEFAEGNELSKEQTETLKQILESNRKGVIRIDTINSGETVTTTIQSNQLFSDLEGQIIRDAPELLEYIDELAVATQGTIQKVSAEADTSEVNRVIDKLENDSFDRGYATGGENIPAGRYLVGEQGPEILDVPGGSNIANAGATKGLMQPIQVPALDLSAYERSLDKLESATGRSGAYAEVIFGRNIPRALETGSNEVIDDTQTMVLLLNAETRRGLRLVEGQIAKIAKWMDELKQKVGEVATAIRKLLEGISWPDIGLPDIPALAEQIIPVRWEVPDPPEWLLGIAEVITVRVEEWTWPEPPALPTFEWPQAPSPEFSWPSVPDIEFSWPSIPVPDWLPIGLELPSWLPITIESPQWLPITIQAPEWLPISIPTPEWLPIKIEAPAEEDLITDPMVAEPEWAPLEVTKPEWVPLEVLKPDWIPIQVEPVTVNVNVSVSGNGSASTSSSQSGSTGQPAPSDGEPYAGQGETEAVTTGSSSSGEGTYSTEYDVTQWTAPAITPRTHPPLTAPQIVPTYATGGASIPEGSQHTQTTAAAAATVASVESWLRDGAPVDTGSPPSDSTPTSEPASSPTLAGASAITYAGVGEEALMGGQPFYGGARPPQQTGIPYTPAPPLVTSFPHTEANLTPQGIPYIDHYPETTPIPFESQEPTTYYASNEQNLSLGQAGLLIGGGAAAIAGAGTAIYAGMGGFSGGGGGQGGMPVGQTSGRGRGGFVFDPGDWWEGFSGGAQGPVAQPGYSVRLADEIPDMIAVEIPDFDFDDLFPEDAFSNAGTDLENAFGSGASNLSGQLSHSLYQGSSMFGATFNAGTYSIEDALINGSGEIGNSMAGNIANMNSGLSTGAAQINHGLMMGVDAFGDTFGSASVSLGEFGSSFGGEVANFNTHSGTFGSEVANFDVSQAGFGVEVGNFNTYQGEFNSSIGSFGTFEDEFTGGVGDFGTAGSGFNSDVGLFSGAENAFAVDVGNFSGAQSGFNSDVGSFGSAQDDLSSSIGLFGGYEDGFTSGVSDFSGEVGSFSGAISGEGSSFTGGVANFAGAIGGEDGPSFLGGVADFSDAIINDDTGLGAVMGTGAEAINENLLSGADYFMGIGNEAGLDPTLTMGAGRMKTAIETAELPAITVNVKRSGGRRSSNSSSGSTPAEPIGGDKDSPEGGKEGHPTTGGGAGGPGAAPSTDDDDDSYASGTMSFKGGDAIVGEYGPELVRLPHRTQIHSNAATRRMFEEGDMGGDTYYLNIDVHDNDIKDQQTAANLGNTIARRIISGLQRQGKTSMQGIYG